MLKNLSYNRTGSAIVLNMLLAAVSLFVNGFGIYLTIQARHLKEPRHPVRDRVHCRVLLHSRD